jgi:hypothetical protein
MRLRGVSAIVLAVLSTTAVACGEERGGNTGVQAQPDEFIARATVLEDNSHGPQICLGGVQQSLPPQCGGPDLLGWDWADLLGFEHAGGARWGDFVVIGSYDEADQTLTLTRPAVPADEYEGPYFAHEEPEPVWSTPCAPPADGWRVVDPSLTSEESLNLTMRAAQSRSDFGGLWVDQSINPAAANADKANVEWQMNDPAKLILNVAVTGNPQVAETDLRSTWGGALCVSEFQHTENELHQIQRAISAEPGVLSTGTGRDVVQVAVIWDDGSLQARFDDQFGPGSVSVSSALERFRQ